MANDLIHELTAGYALHALDPQDESEYVEHLATCERCRAELAAFQETAGALALAVDPVEPPPALRARILSTARAERPNVVPLRPRWARPRTLAAVAAVAACAVVGLGVWNAVLHSQLSASRSALQAVGIKGANGSLVVGADGQATLVVTGLHRARTGKTYEAWVIQNGVPQSAALFDGGSTSVVRLGPRVPKGAIVAVTVERAGGVTKPTTTPIVVSARV
ncbi:MAG: anti-sigma factor [Actinobacteria bacterium]|nr:anti-sigma factor [Actinomycetota bacterium]MBV8561961.1 anti-sigma factor [Actinomycetota bacterium]